MSLVRYIVLVLMAMFIVSCKIKIVVPEGGSVVSASGAYNCSSGETCKLDVVDTFFSETFTAVPADGYEFHKWKKRANAICPGTSTPCDVSTEGFGEFPALMAVLESNEVFQLKPIFVKRSKPLRVFQDGDEIRYRGELSFEDADGVSLAPEEITGAQAYSDSGSSVNGIETMLEISSLFNAEGGLFSNSATDYYQTENGERIEVGQRIVIDQGAGEEGEFFYDLATETFGVLGLPSPLIPLSKQKFAFENVSRADAITSLATVTRVIKVSKLKNVTVPLGSYKAYKVTSTQKSELLVGDTAGAKTTTDLVQWIVPDIGPIKIEISQLSYDKNGVYEGVFEVSLEAVGKNY